MVSNIRVGIVGFGYAAQTFHVPFLRSLATTEAVEIRAVSSSDAAKVHQLLPDVEVLSDHHALCGHEDLDLVIITSPNDSHALLASCALAAGKHVLLEKPLTTNYADAVALQQLAAAQERLLVPFQNRRWDGDFLTVKKLVADGSLGKVHYVESHFDRFRPQPRDRWRENGGEGSGIFWDLGPHLLDQALQLFGQPSHLTATLRALRPAAKAVDYFKLQLHYADKEVVLCASPYMAAANPRFTLQGELATYLKSGLDPQEDALKSGMDPQASSFGIEAEALWGQLYFATEHQPVATLHGDYLGFYQQLLDAIRGQAPAPVPIADAVEVIRLLALSEESAASGCRVSCD
ncbi:oxidoreductase [Corallincola holothuriorum]|uniref:Oxidoreductase n=1 Tax=Corallincola holothuriorum TaxID=2282215 RepID=A0A368NK50_9GAMM|nr:oxidoreductase [Corallincola holothuriorum]